jgi:L-lactate dehydrogenase complex protein LldG
MTARDEILDRIRRASHPVAHPEPWISRRAFADPVGRFVEALVAVSGEAMIVENLDAALDRLDELFRQAQVRRVVANGDLPIDAARLRGRWPAIEWHIVGESEGDLREFCARADLGLSGARAALAETGSVLVESGPKQSRLATLLPPIHVALVPSSCVVPDIFAWAADRGPCLAASMTFVSGPSKTADIEMVLSIGVHGPKRFVALVVGVG